MRTLTLTFPMPLNLANSRGHWRRKHRAKLAWEMEALVQEPRLRGRVEPLRRVRASAVFYIRHNGHQMDDDNATARLKWVFDLLKERRLIEDDRQPYLTLVGPPEQRVGTPRRLVLTLEEVA